MTYKILVVDDEKDIRELISKSLTRLGDFQVEQAESGEEALQKVKQMTFDLVLADLKMEKMDGIQLISEIAKSKPDILTIIMTGQGSIDSALQAMKRGASDYITKPLNIEETIIRLRKVVEDRQRFVNLKDFASQLELANQELQKADAIKSEFVSVASHELRTPLASIKNVVHLMLSGKTGEVNENQKRFLSMAERNINRLTHILTQLLSLSKIESGKIELWCDRFDLKNVIESTVSTLRIQAEEKSIRINVDVEEPFPTLFGDQEKIEQVLTNLLDNAIKFTPERGSVQITAKVLHEKTDQDNNDRVTLSVKDTGIGIPPEHLKAVFDKFYQVENSLHRTSVGSGLGLSICEGLIEAHQGKIWAESEQGKGSTFTILLPVVMNK